MKLPDVVVVHPADRHSRILRDLLAPLGTGGNLTTDAHLAALSIEHGRGAVLERRGFLAVPRRALAGPSARPRESPALGRYQVRKPRFEGRTGV